MYLRREGHLQQLRLEQHVALDGAEGMALRLRGLGLRRGQTREREQALHVLDAAPLLLLGRRHHHHLSLGFEL